jgi:peptide/nickel transport system substrate-binding protein
VKNEMEKMDTAIVVLVLIGIIVSSGTMYYSTIVTSDLSTLTSDVSTLTESVSNLTSTVADLAAIMAEGFEEYAEAIATLEARLAAIEVGLAAGETLIVGTTDSVELTLDPAQAYDFFGWCILQQIGGTLVSVEPGSPTGADFIPDLAVDWNASEDLDVWDLNLRQGVMFGDGAEFNATHVKYSFDRAIALIPSIPEGAPAGLGYDSIINRTEVLDTYKVRFHLNYPFSPFPGILASRSSTIVNPQYAPIEQINHTAADTRASTPVAFAGPYVLSKWVRVAGRDVEIKLDANPNYWDLASGYPKMEHIVFRFYSDAASLRLAIEAGDVDMAFRHISPTDVLDLEGNPNVRVWWGTGAQIQYLCFQTIRAPFNDTRVRVAVAAALDRITIADTVFLGLMDPLYSIIPAGMLGHTEAFAALGDMNYTLTRSLLADAGYDETNKLEFDLWYESSGHYPMSAEQALVHKAAFEASGVMTVTLHSADWASYKQNRDDEIMDAYVYGWYPDYVDPDNYAFLYWAAWIHTNYQTTSPVAYAQQQALYDAARATTNTTLREELYAQIDDIAVEQCSVVPIWAGTGYAITKPDVYGLYLDITQDMRYWLVSK